MTRSLALPLGITVANLLVEQFYLQLTGESVGAVESSNISCALHNMTLLSDNVTTVGAFEVRNRACTMDTNCMWEKIYVEHIVCESSCKNLFVNHMCFSNIQKMSQAWTTEYNINMLQNLSTNSIANLTMTTACLNNDAYLAATQYCAFVVAGFGCFGVLTSSLRGKLDVMKKVGDTDTNTYVLPTTVIIATETEDFEKN